MSSGDGIQPVSYTHLSLAEALPLSFQQYGYDSIPNLYTILDTSSLDSAGISRTAEQPFLGNKGRGTLIGIVDTGIDYTNPLLRDPDGSTRIAAIWDQTVDVYKRQPQQMPVYLPR